MHTLVLRTKHKYSICNARIQIFELAITFPCFPSNDFLLDGWSLIESNKIIFLCYELMHTESQFQEKISQGRKTQERPIRQWWQNQNTARNDPKQRDLKHVDKSTWIRGNMLFILLLQVCPSSVWRGNHVYRPVSTCSRAWSFFACCSLFLYHNSVSWCTTITLWVSLMVSKCPGHICPLATNLFLWVIARGLIFF